MILIHGQSENREIHIDWGNCSGACRNIPPLFGEFFDDNREFLSLLSGLHWRGEHHLDAHRHPFLDDTYHV